MKFDFPSPLLQYAELWRFATRKAIGFAISLQNNILFGLLLMDASRNWKPWVHDTSVSVHVEVVFLLSLHVYACDRMNLCTQLNTACCIYCTEITSLKRDLKQGISYTGYGGILHIWTCKQLYKYTCNLWSFLSIIYVYNVTIKLKNPNQCLGLHIKHSISLHLSYL